MLDPSAHHSEPFGEAFSYSSQRAAQMVSLVATAADVFLRRRAMQAARQATRDEQKRRMLHAQEGAFRAQVRAGWAPALDARWLAQADLLQAGRAWGAAAPWSDNDPEAAAALRRAEERLRTLHPYAMNRYDRLRREGASPLDAMREAVQLFDREPHVRPGQPAPGHLAVEVGQPGVGTASGADATTDGPGQPASGPDPYQEAERRGRTIAERLQACALHERGAQLSPDELAIALEASTSLPAEVIARLARAEAEERVAAAAERTRAADLGHAAAAPSVRVRAGDLEAARHDTVTAETAGAHASADRTAAQLPAESFPCTAADGIRAAAAERLLPSLFPDRTAGVQNIRRITVSP
jgi:hypothetical protein